jgi:hypothetical protein
VPATDAKTRNVLADDDLENETACFAKIVQCPCSKDRYKKRGLPAPSLPNTFLFDSSGS